MQAQFREDSAVKILVLSDIHLELGISLTLPPSLTADSYDVALLAGDIHSPGHKAVYWAQRGSTFGGKPALLVPGNHEFYGRLMPTELAEMKQAAAGSNVHLLDRDCVIIDGARFLGCILWTDFQLPVRQPWGGLEVDVGRALSEANRCMNDFRRIEVLSPSRNRPRFPERTRQLQASDALAMHWTDRDWLRRQLAQPFSGLTVVVMGRLCGGHEALHGPISWVLALALCPAMRKSPPVVSNQYGKWRPKVPKGALDLHLFDNLANLVGATALSIAVGDAKCQTET